METEQRDDGEISIIALLTTIVRNRGKIIGWALAIGLLAGLSAWRRPLLYMARATFATQGGSVPTSGIASLAGQLGLTSGASPTSSPDFYIMLIHSPVLLSKVVQDTFVVQEQGGKRLSVYQILDVTGRDSVERQQRAMDVVKSLVVTEKQKGTGLVQVSVATLWPSVSKSFVTSVVNAVDTYNQETRRSQAAVERKFIERRLAEALVDLREAEDRYQRFLAANRAISTASVLAFQRDGLNRAVQLKQQVYTTLATSYEDARIREVRDTPVISVIEPPRVKHDPESRGRVKRAAIGVVIGGFIGLMLTLVSEGVRRLGRNREGEAEELRASMRDAKDSMRRVLRLSR